MPWSAEFIPHYAKKAVIVRNKKGPGLTENDKAQLFGKFKKLSARPTAGESSTGLGLSIVKMYVEIMYGKIWCESEASKGATFIVEIPKAEPTLKAATAS